MLGVVLAHELRCSALLTDTPTAAVVLRSNVATAAAALAARGASALAAVLRWDVPADRDAVAQLMAEPPQLICGTDIIFAERLVGPLLSTLHALAGPDTVVFLCVQVKAREGKGEDGGDSNSLPHRTPQALVATFIVKRRGRQCAMSDIRRSAVAMEWNVRRTSLAQFGVDSPAIRCSSSCAGALHGGTRSDAGTGAAVLPASCGLYR